MPSTLLDRFEMSRNSRWRNTRDGMMTERYNAACASGNQEIVEVAQQFKSRVIGKGGHKIKQIKDMSGASVQVCNEGFVVRGSEEQMECAKMLIQDVVNPNPMSMARVRKDNDNVDNAEVVNVDECFISHVIGKEGRNIKMVAQQSGASVKVSDVGFLVSGSKEQKQNAKEHILEIVTNLQKDVSQELVDIPDSFKGVVIGRGGQTLNKISTMTGAQLFRMRSKVFVTGTQEAKEKALLEVKRIVSKARLSDRRLRLKACCFVDDFKLPHNCDLSLVPFESKSRTPECTHYQLRLTEDNEARGDARIDSEVPSYLEDLKKTVFQCLLEIKEQIEPGQSNDMWCHFGTVLIEIADEGDESSIWTLDGATDKLNDVEENTGKPQWCTKFKEGVDFDEKPQLGNVLEKPVYDTRHDLNFLTPSGRAVRCKVWVKEKGCEGEDAEIPFNDVKNILEVFSFTDKKTNERCKGWLCLPSVRRLKADIIFPACNFDCRITIRGNGIAMERSPAHQEEELILMEYLSRLTLKEGEEDELLLTDKTLPRGFHLDFSRRCRRTSLSFDKDFTIIVSKETSFQSDGQDGNNIERKTDLHLHCNKWNELLRSGQWAPQDIVDNLAEFLKFVKMVQKFMLLDPNE